MILEVTYFIPIPLICIPWTLFVSKQVKESSCALIRLSKMGHMSSLNNLLRYTTNLGVPAQGMASWKYFFHCFCSDFFLTRQKPAILLHHSTRKWLCQWTVNAHSWCSGDCHTTARISTPMHAFEKKPCIYQWCSWLITVLFWLMPKNTCHLNWYANYWT